MIERNQLLTRRVIIGLRYYDHNRSSLLKERLIYGVVVKVMDEDGIIIELAPDSQAFTLPSDISGWHHAPPAHYMVPGIDDDVVNPDYLVRWDIVRQSDSSAQQSDGEHQWWEWQTVSESPIINGVQA